MDNKHKGLIAFQTIFIKETSRFLRVWVQTLLPPAITSILYFLIFGHIMGRKIGTMHGLPYIQYIAPGLIMMYAISSSYASPCFSFFQAKALRNIEELLASPVSTGNIVAGFVVAGAVRGIVTAFLVSIVTLFFTHLPLSYPFLTICTISATSILFALAGLINGIFSKDFADVSMITTFIITPLTYLGGVFYSVSLLPHIWATVSLFNPIVYVVNLFRYGTTGRSDVNVMLAFSLIVALILLLYTMAWFLVDRRIGIKN